MNRVIRYRDVRMYLSSLFLFCCMIFCSTTYVDGQIKSRTRLKIYYEKLPNNDKKISIILTQGSGKKIEGVQNAEIFLRTYDLDNEIDITSLTTDSIGEVLLFIEANYRFTKDVDGYSVIKATYNGNDSLKSSKNQIKFMDLNIDISFDVVDSVKLLTVLTFEIDSIGNRKPIGGIGLNIGVERLYSTLYLQKVETNEDGIANMDFPNDIPGDSAGTIKVIAKVDEHDDYGTITKSSNIKWGTIVDYSITSNGRSLFGDEAPLWMIISVAVILIGAWYNFMRALYRMVRMKNSGSI